MRRWIGLLLVLSMFAGAAFAQAIPAANTLVRASAAALSAHAGGAPASVDVRLEVLPGWHVYSNPPSLDYNIPTQVSLVTDPGMRAGAPKYPQGTQVRAAGEDKPVSVYDQVVHVSLPLTVSASTANGRHLLHGKVRYQGCNDQMCLAPVAIPFTVEVTVDGGGAAPAAAATAAPGSSAAPDSAAVASAPDTAKAGPGFMTAPPAGGAPSQDAARSELEKKLSMGLVWWLLWMFLGGLGLNLSPCVFPMLGITVSIFGARKTETTPKAMLNAFAYVLGIMLMYTSLGLVAALTGRMFGAALQNPLVSIGIGVLLMVLSLSMFGFYELQAPAWMLDRVGGANTGSLAGLFVSGLAVGVVAAPCVGSFIIGLLAIIGQRGSIAFGLQSMGMLSLGLGLPYLVLATFSNLLGKLPRAGDWMDWVKKLFGVVLVSWGAFYVLVGVAPRASLWLLPTALVLGGLYLGFMEKSANRLARFKRFKNVLGGLAVIAGVAMVLQLTTAAARTIAFRPYDEAAVEASLKSGRGVIIDFAADWCVPCHELELDVFPDRAVVAAAKPFDAYKADLTHGDTPASRRYEVAGVPTIVFLGAGGHEVREVRVTGKVPAAEFARRLGVAAAAIAPH